MSVSATTAAKRRRAGNVVSSQLFKPTSAPIENSIQRRTGQNVPVQTQTPLQPTPQNVQSQSTPVSSMQQANSQRPMSLQQVISVFDKRLLHIESIIANDQQSLNQSAPVNQPSINNEQVQEIIQHYMNQQTSEFDHRYQMLATEIANLKQIVLKLQSYTLDVNKSLIEERIQILSDMKASVVIQPEDTLNLKEDMEELSQTVQEDDSEQNITFSLNNDIKEELMQDSLALDNEEEDVIEEVVQETASQDVIEDVIEEVVQETASQDVSEDVIEEVVQETASQDVIEDVIEEVVQETASQDVIEDEKQQLSEDLTELSKESSDQTFEEVPTKQKRKRKNKKNISVNV